MNKKITLEVISKYRTELMGLAIIGVMIGHVLNHTSFHPPIIAHTIRLLHTPAFLFLSGFGLYYSFSKDSKILPFLKKRLTRLYLPFLIIASPLFILELATGLTDGLQFLGRISTLGFWIEGNFCGMWYVAVLMMLYALFPLMYQAMFNKQSKPFVVTTIIVCSMIALFAFIQKVTRHIMKRLDYGFQKPTCFRSVAT